MNGMTLRLSKLFPDHKNTVIVAIDHGQTFGPPDGITPFQQAAEKLQRANGVLLAPHMIQYSGHLFQGASSPVVITRLNWNTIHCEPWQYQTANIVRTLSVREAVRAGAEIVLASLTLRTGDEAHDARNVQTFSQSVEEAYGLGIPIIGEVFPTGGLRGVPDDFHDYIKKMCRIIAELGANAVKTFYTGPKFNEVVEGTPIPIFALGAEKFKNEIDALRLAKRATEAGAKGVVFGRNVVQAHDSQKFLTALCEVVQEAAIPEEVAAKYQLL
jgi:DhnA family fructose-bisphosphate aldolase class Ia